MKLVSFGFKKGATHEETSLKFPFRLLMMRKVAINRNGYGVLSEGR